MTFPPLRNMIVGLRPRFPLSSAVCAQRIASLVVRAYVGGVRVSLYMLRSLASATGEPAAIANFC